MILIGWYQLETPGLEARRKVYTAVTNYKAVTVPIRIRIGAVTELIEDEVVLQSMGRFMMAGNDRT